jgi:hypothetical protein
MAQIGNWYWKINNVIIIKNTASPWAKVDQRNDKKNGLYTT